MLPVTIIKTIINPFHYFLITIVVKALLKYDITAQIYFFLLCFTYDYVLCVICVALSCHVLTQALHPLVLLTTVDALS